MSDKTTAGVGAEELAYARAMAIGSNLGFVILVIGFLLYAFGLVDAQVPVADLPTLWKLPATEYLARTGLPTGWGWVGLLPKGDMLGLLGIAVLSAVSLPCFVLIGVRYLRAGDKAFLAIAVLEVAVLVLAASGILTAGH